MRFAITLILSVLLVACEAQKTTSYPLPTSLGGRMCVNQCQFAEDYCRDACNVKQSHCVTDVRTQAMTDYDKYTHEQYTSHQEGELYASDFERMGPCNKSYDACYNLCESNYKSCYGNCGGKADTKPTCHPFCF